MTYNASSELVSKIISLSAEIVVGLGTSLPFGKGRRLFRELEDALGELDVAAEPSGRHERALIKAANRAVQHFMLAGIAGELDEIADHDLKQYTIPKSLADVREILNFVALSKALMAFDNGEAKSVVDLMLPTVYIWQEKLPEGTPVPSGDTADQLYWRVQPFANGRPMESLDSKLCRAYYKTREGALDAVRSSNFGIVTNQLGGVSSNQPGPDVYQIVEGESPKPYLYILMRNDLASLNAGKAVAQGTHAANQMVGELRASAMHSIMEPSPNSIHAALAVWEKEAHHFGTCIVLAVNEAQMRASVAKALGDTQPSHAGICHDPTYPLMDGKTFHFIPVDTCAYVFDYPARAKRHLVGYPLMP